MINSTVITASLTRDKKKFIAVGLLFALVFSLTMLLNPALPLDTDWQVSYRPAVRLMFTGQWPYSARGFYNPPWFLLPLLPFALLPEKMSVIALVFLSVAANAFIAHRLGARAVALLIFLLSPPVLADVMILNLNWLPLLGVFLPPQVGLFFVLAKPQLGLAIAAYWLVEAWRAGKARQVLRVFTPVTLTLLLSFLLYGFYPAVARDVPITNVNLSAWPYGIPAGLALLYVSLRSRQIRPAISASPFLSPYVGPQSWSAALLGLASSNWKMAAAVIGMWVLTLNGIARAFLR